MTDREEFQIVLRLVCAEAADTHALEDAADAALSVLLEKGAGVTLGVVAGANLNDSAVELEFTLEVRSTADLYSTMPAILGWLSEAGFEFLGSTEERMTPRATGRLLLA